MMTANVNVNGSIIRISVGEGRQTFKWLAQIIQARISEANSLRSEFGPENVVVVGLKNYADQLINPKDSLFEHQNKNEGSSITSCDDLMFTAQVLPQFESDQFGNPVYGEWLQAAYMVSDSAQKWAQEMQSWRDSELDRFNKKLEDSDDDRNWNSNIETASSFVNIGDDQFLKLDLNMSFTLDWCNIKFLWLEKIKISTKIAIHEVLKANYDIICHLFLHYCGVGKVGQRFGMTLCELNHLLTLATKTHKAKCVVAGANVYSKVNVSRPKKSESKKAGTAFRSKSPPRTAVSSFAAPTSSTTCNADSDGEDVQAVAVEDRNVQQTPVNPVSDVQEGNTMSPLLSRSAFAECMMCFAVEEEMGSTIPEAISNFLSGPLKAVLATFHRSLLKYTEPEFSMLRESYDLLRDLFSEKAAVHPTLGPSVCVDDFIDIASSVAILSEVDGTREQKRAIYEQAFCFALLRSPTVEKEKSSIVHRRRSSYGSKFEGKESDFLSDEDGPQYPGDGLLGIGDQLVSTEFAEAFAKLALLSSTLLSDVGNIGKIQICYDLLTKKVVEEEIIEVEPPAEIPEPVEVLALPIKKVIPKKRHW